jgi:3-deoxy-D-manno-octulosonic-acid transferase
LLEPVWAGTPVLYGPSVDNVYEAAGYISRHEFGAEVKDSAELGTAVGELIAQKRAFKRKTDNDLRESATAVAGDYILRHLHDV